MPQPHQVGQHSFHVEEDVVFVKYVAGVSLDELKQMDAIVDPVVQTLPSIYLVYDVSQAGLMTPEARRYAAERSKNLRCYAIVIYGTTLFTRAAIALVLSAARLIAKQIPETVYVNSDSDARLWIAAHRLRGAKSQKS